MPIKNLSNIRRLPRLGKIHLGIKEISDKTGKEYPSEVDYFVCPPKVQGVFGEKPKELRIMFPVEDTEVFFQQWYKRYTYDLLKCKGDGDKAWTWDDEHGGMKEIECPCEHLENGNCRKIGILQFLLPDVPGAGIWQITTSSRNSIIDINSSIDYIKATCGRVRMIPLVLKRVPTDIQRIENGKPKRGKHYTLQIDVENITLRQLQEAAQVAPEKVLLPPPDESKDELFYPENGFKPKEPEEEVRSENPKDDIKPYKEKLSFLLNKYKDLNGKLTPREEERLDVLGEDVKKHEEAIKYFTAKISKLENKDKPDGLFEGEEA